MVTRSSSAGRQCSAQGSEGRTTSEDELSVHSVHCPHCARGHYHHCFPFLSVLFDPAQYDEHTRTHVEKHKFCSDGSTWRCEVSHFCAQILEKRLWVHFRPVFLRSLKGQTAPAAAASDHGTRVLTTCHQLNCMYTKPLLKDYKIFIRAFTLYMAPL